MKDTTEKLPDVMPSATPSAEDLRRWEALPRDEQLRRLRASLTQPECSTEAADSMTDILATARAQADSRRG